MYYIPLRVCVCVCVQHKQLYFFLFHVDLFNNSATAGRQPFKMLLSSSPGQPETRNSSRAGNENLLFYCLSRVLLLLL